MTLNKRNKFSGKFTQLQTTAGCWFSLGGKLLFTNSNVFYECYRIERDLLAMYAFQDDCFKMTCGYLERRVPTNGSHGCHQVLHTLPLMSHINIGLKFVTTFIYSERYEKPVLTLLGHY